MDYSSLSFAPLGRREDFRQRDEWDRPQGNGWLDRITLGLPVSYSVLIIAICIVIFLLTPLVPGFVYNYLALNPDYVIQRPWTLITHMFVHDGFFHLFFNMWALFLFGSDLERRVGEGRFLEIYLISGIIGAVGQMLVSSGIMVGASGAIFGVMGCLAIIAPEIRLMIFPIPIPMSIRSAILIFAFIDFYSQLGIGGADNIAHMAHIAGLLGGLAFGYAMKRQPKYYYNL